MLSFNFKTPEQLLIDLGARATVARLRLNMSRKTLSERSGVPESSIKRFEKTGLIGSSSLVDLLIVLDKVDGFDHLLTETAVPTIRELDARKRQRGRL